MTQNTTVISEHLNKIHGYDNECLRPVFIAVYCDVNDFRRLVTGYVKLIESQDYTGYTANAGANRHVATLQSTEHLWLGVERRRRNQCEIVFYHLLLNMHT